MGRGDAATASRSGKDTTRGGGGGGVRGRCSAKGGGGGGTDCGEDKAIEVGVVASSSAVRSMSNIGASCLVTVGVVVATGVIEVFSSMGVSATGSGVGVAGVVVVWVAKATGLAAAGYNNAETSSAGSGEGVTKHWVQIRKRRSWVGNSDPNKEDTGQEGCTVAGIN